MAATCAPHPCHFHNCGIDVDNTITHIAAYNRELQLHGFEFFNMVTLHDESIHVNIMTLHMVYRILCPTRSVDFISVVTSYVELRKEEPQTGYAMSFTRASHIASRVQMG